jgi:hypothetical protein
MPVYRETGLIHIHIPKTAGTAIESFFHSIGDMVWGLDSWLGEKYVGERWYEFQHLTISEFFSFTGEEFLHFGSFAVVRNPYSRLISEFLWRRQLKQRPDSTLIHFDSFDDFIRAIPSDIDSNWQSYLNSADKRESNLWIHLRPQHHYICGEDGKQIVREILQFERLKPEFDRLLDRYGLSTDSIRTPEEKSLERFFDRGLFDQVNEIYARDFELGRYQIL